MRLKIPGLCAAALLAAFLYPPAHATVVLQMSLDDLASRAGRVFRGSVILAEPGSTEIGGGSLPTVTYELLVEERFKGTSRRTTAKPSSPSPWSAAWSRAAPTWTGSDA